MRRSILFSPLLVCLLLLGSCGDPEPVRVGFIGGLTGRASDIGIASRNAVQLAIDTVNASGGIDGRQIELLVRDDEGSAEGGADAARFLVGEKVAAIIGPNLSVVASGVVPVINEAKVVTVSPTVSSLAFVGKNDYFYRANSTAGQFAEAYAQHLKDRRILHIAAATDGRNAVFSESWLNEFQKHYKSHGGKVSKALAFDSAVGGEFTRVVKDLLAADPEALLFIANGVDTAQLSQQARKHGATLPIIAAEWAGTESLIKLGGNAVEGVELLQTYDRYDESEHYVHFRDTYLKRFRNDPSFASIAAYDCATVLFAALRSRSSGNDLKASIDSLDPVIGLQQQVSFDSFGDGTRRLVFVTVENGKFILK